MCSALSLLAGKHSIAFFVLEHGRDQGRVRASTVLPVRGANIIGSPRAAAPLARCYYGQSACSTPLFRSLPIANPAPTNPIGDVRLCELHDRTDLRINKVTHAALHVITSPLPSPLAQW